MDIENHEQLQYYLRQHGHIGAKETPTYASLTGGVANKTILVQRTNANSFVLKQALGKFRVAVDWYADPQRSHVEVMGLQAFQSLAPDGAIPLFLFEDEGEFLHAIEAIPQPHRVYKDLLLERQGTVELAQRFGSLMATIHVNALRQADRLEPLFDDLTHFESQRLEPFYAYTAEQVPASAEFIRTLIEQTRTTRVSLVHGDFTPKNVLVRGDGSLVLLDFEIVHWGDPAFDVGLALAHLVAKAITLRSADKKGWQEVHAFLDAYAAVASQALHTPMLLDRAFAHFLACLLARVRGRSPLNYLAIMERHFIEQRVLVMMDQPSIGISDLGAFVPDL